MYTAHNKGMAPLGTVGSHLFRFFCNIHWHYQARRGYVSLRQLKDTPGVHPALHGGGLPQLPHTQPQAEAELPLVLPSA